jgi:Matrixin
MRRIFISLLLSCCLLAAFVPARSYTFQYTSNSAQIHWPSNTITIAFSTSLSSPGTNIKPGTDVVGTVRRAMQRWAEAANVQFIETSSAQQDVGQDGVNLITIADTPTNRNVFANGGENQARTRVFFDPATGLISEADIVLNPAVTGRSGYGFSTDGTDDTFDLESTFTHEFGHLLGLNHSGVIGATMQPRQGRNFNMFGLNAPALTMRTLEDDDLAGVRALYGPRAAQPVGALAGHVNYGAGAHVWAENFFNGRIYASAITKSDGSYDIEQLPAGQYRVGCEYLDEPVTAAEIAPNGGPYTGIGSQPQFVTVESQATVNAGATTTLNLTVNNGSAPTIHPQVFGVNGLLIGSPTQIVAGQTYRFYVGGFGVDTVTAAGFSFNVPNITIDRTSYQVENSAAFGVTYPIVSFNITVADTGKFGDYSLRMQRPDTGEINYLVGALALDPYVQYVELNPIDRSDFFVTQQYLDFLFRQPDQAGFNAWMNVLNNCSDVNNNPNCDRILVSSSFFGSPEFQLKGYFVYRFYKLAFNRLPTYAEVIPDMISLTGQTQAEVFQKRTAFVNNFVQRPAFVSLYGAMSNTDFVNTLMARYSLTSIITPDPQNPDGTTKVTLTNADLTNGLNAGTLTRAQVVRAIADSDQVFNLEYNQAFVYMQYVGYLRRDPEPGGYNAWLNYLNTHPTDSRTMVNGFMNASEYRMRFGQP